jgi:hypothetical protein
MSEYDITLEYKTLEEAVAAADYWRKMAQKFEKALEIYQRERDRFKHAKPEMTGAYFLAGGHGLKDDNQLPQFVEICPAYGCAWVQIYEDTGRTISYEGS